jgi:hypothetical protein
VQRQVEESGCRVSYAQAKLHVVLNDTKPHALGRLILVITALRQLADDLSKAGKLHNGEWTTAQGLRQAELLERSCEAQETGNLLYHLYAGAFLLPLEGVWLEVMLEEFDKGFRSGICPWGWIEADEATITALHGVMVEWRELLAEGKATESIAAGYAKVMERGPLEGVERMYGLQHGPSQLAAARIEESRKELRRVCMAEIDTWDDETILEVSGTATFFLGGGAGS